MRGGKRSRPAGILARASPRDSCLKRAAPGGAEPAFGKRRPVWASRLQARRRSLRGSPGLLKIHACPCADRVCTAEGGSEPCSALARLASRPRSRPSPCAWSGSVCSSGRREHHTGKKGGESKAAPIPRPQSPEKQFASLSPCHHPSGRAARAAQPARGPAGEAERLPHRCPRAASAGPPRPLPCFSPGSVPRVTPLRSCPARASRPRPRRCWWGPLRPREPCSGVSTCARCSGSRYFCGDRGGGQPGRAIQSLVLPRSHSVTPRTGTCTKCRPSLTPSPLPRPVL